jgi:hypothetical protein
VRAARRRAAMCGGARAAADRNVRDGGGARERRCGLRTQSELRSVGV